MPEETRREFLQEVAGASAKIATEGLPLPTFERLPSIPETKIDGITTFGHAEALSSEGLAQLMDLFKVRYFLGLRPQYARTVYGTFFIRESDYERFRQRTGESYQSFVQRHTKKASELFKFANPAGMTGGFVAREVAVLKDGVPYPASYEQGYLKNQVKGSDGTYMLPSNYSPYTDYYDPESDLDQGYIHESVWHSIVKGNDARALSFDGYPLPEFFQNFPLDWETYPAEARSDICGGDISHAPSEGVFQIGLYDAYLLKRRVQLRIQHNWEKTFVDYLGWRPDLPRRVNFAPKDLKGNTIKPTSIEIYRTSPSPYTSGVQGGYNKDLDPVPVYTGSSTNIDPKKIFPISQYNLGSSAFPYIEDNRATILVRFRTDHGDYIRWMDVRDFQLAHWTGHTWNATLSFQCLSTKDNVDPENFPWKVNYS